MRSNQSLVGNELICNQHVACWLRQHNFKAELIHLAVIHDKGEGGDVRMPFTVSQPALARAAKLWFSVPDQEVVK